jgi:hypothetical protein
MESRIGLALILSVFTAACGARVIHGLESVPAEYQLKLAKLPRVWVAGFATGKKPEFDLNLETVRLIRTQLRTWSSAQVIQAEPLTIETEQRLSDITYWRRLGEEYGRPLIITDEGLIGAPMIKKALAAVKDSALFGAVRGNPALSHVEAGLRAYLSGGHDGVVAFGGSRQGWRSTFR